MTDHEPGAAGLAAGDETELAAFLEASLARPETRLASGYQGQVHVVERDGQRWVVKAAMGKGPALWLRRAMLRREHRVYRRLEGFRGAPKCHGLIAGHFLMLEPIDGIPFRHAQLADREQFFADLMVLLQEMHGRGVAHGDLKRKENLLVVDHRHPKILDFGAAIVQEPATAPLNHLLFRLLRQFDLNAWVKLKYQGTGQPVSPEDAQHRQRTLPEKLAQTLKRAYLNLRWPKGAPPKDKPPPKLGE